MTSRELKEALEELDIETNISTPIDDIYEGIEALIKEYRPRYKRQALKALFSDYYKAIDVLKQIKNIILHPDVEDYDLDTIMNIKEWLTYTNDTTRIFRTDKYGYLRNITEDDIIDLRNKLINALED